MSEGVVKGHAGFQFEETLRSHSVLIKEWLSNDQHGITAGFFKGCQDQLGLSQKAFAERIGASESTLKKWILSTESGANTREMPLIV